MSNVCKICTQTLTQKSPGLQCNICDLFYHFKCVELSKQQLETAKSLTGFMWCCIACRDKTKASTTKDNLGNKCKCCELIPELLSTIEELRTTIENLKVQNEMIDKSNNQNSIETIINEISERQRRENNIIIHKLAESQDDMIVTKNIIQSLELNINTENIKIRRIGNGVNNSSRPLIVTLSSKEDAIKVKEKIKCKLCHFLFHLKCITISDGEILNQSSWLCPTCARGTESDESSQSIDELVPENKMNPEINSQKTVEQDINKSLEFCNEKSDENTKLITAQNEQIKKQQELFESLVTENSILKKQINQLKYYKMQVNKSIRNQFLCLVCGKIMHPPIKICTIGHNFCSICDYKSLDCPYCNYSKGQGRNILLENIYSCFVFPCNDKTESCDFVGNGPEIKEHQLSCANVTVKCPINVLCCDWYGKTGDILKHALSSHADRLIHLESSSSFVIATKLIPSANIRILINIYSKVFLFTWCINADCTTMTWQIILLESQNTESFLYTVELYDPLESIAVEHNYAKAKCETSISYIKFSDEKLFENFIYSDRVYCRIVILEKKIEPNQL
ncbi:hypothetical protein RN001_004271 [Aquatica leii]|uniref:RING-type E3 ubiquitin transferase n=1 Tax=Aquatica leii TaxID=1421715 RepID=A0AAN7SHD4_9COLE|nr:hypothetical protein RN001_004271 [Aquatica leii]